jgi:hypothetical protein
MGTNNVDRARNLQHIKVHPIPLKLLTNKQQLTRKEKVAKRKEYQQHTNYTIINC